MRFAMWSGLKRPVLTDSYTREVKQLACFSSFSLAALLVATPALASETVTYTYDELGRLVRTSQTGSVNNGVITDIDYDEAGNRTNYEVTGSNGSGAGSGSTGGNGAGGGETPPSFSVSDASAVEGGSLTFTITKNAVKNLSYSVNWTTANGSALNGSDYTGGNGNLVFTGAQTSRTVVIPTIDNNLYEQIETFYVNLTGASGGSTLSDPQGAGTISDDEVQNTAPVANNDSGLISCQANAYAVMSNDTDADGDALTLVSVSGPLNPYISGNYVWVSGTTTNSVYQINYSIKDIHNVTASAVLTLNWVTGPSCGGGGGPEQ